MRIVSNVTGARTIHTSMEMCFGTGEGPEATTINCMGEAAGGQPSAFMASKAFRASSGCCQATWAQGPQRRSAMRGDLGSIGRNPISE